MKSLAEKGNSNLVLMGIEPTYPSEKYGYIIPEKKEKVSRVKEFKEKPSISKAKLIHNRISYNRFFHCFCYSIPCSKIFPLSHKTHNLNIFFFFKEQSSYIKPYVNQIDQQIMFAEKS